MNEPWRDPDRYTRGRVVKCGGCGVRCHKTHWGAWCYACNVERIERISGTLESLIDEYSKPVTAHRP
jgi:hypothetical protein